MSTLTDQRSGFLGAYEQVRELLNAVGLPGLDEVRDRAIRQYSEFGLPTQKDEEFRYVSLRELEEQDFQTGYGTNLSREALLNLPLGTIDALRIVLVNGQFAPELSEEGALPEGAFLGSLAEAYERSPKGVSSRLTHIATFNGKLGKFNDERFTQLNTAFFAEGLVLYLPKASILERTVHLVHITHADHGAIAVYPRCLVVLEEAAEAKLVESYVGSVGKAFCNAVTEIHLGKNTNLEHVRFQGEGDESLHIGTVAIHQEEGSVYHSCNASFGGKVARVEVNLWLNGEHTESRLNGAYVGVGEQVLANHTRIDHAKANCNSFEVYKGILRDKATGVFNGKIYVYEDAQKTDAKQTNQALLLSPTAQINTKPQLEIFADDVKCTHGATVGQLREDALFYLRSRGIPISQAQALLVYAFAAEVLEMITINDVREELERILFDKLEM